MCALHDGQIVEVAVPQTCCFRLQSKHSMTELEGKRGSYSTLVAVKQGSAQRLRGWLAAKPVEAPEAAELGDGWVAMRMDFENPDQARFMVLVS